MPRLRASRTLARVSPESVGDELGQVGVQCWLATDELHFPDSESRGLIDDPLPVFHRHDTVGALWPRFGVAVFTRQLALAGYLQPEESECGGRAKVGVNMHSSPALRVRNRRRSAQRAESESCFSSVQSAAGTASRAAWMAEAESRDGCRAAGTARHSPSRQRPRAARRPPRRLMDDG